MTAAACSAARKAAARSTMPPAVAIASKLSEHELVTDPRRLTDKELDPSGNIAVNLPAALDEAKHPAAERTMTFCCWTATPSSFPKSRQPIQVIGAVTNQRGVLFLPGNRWTTTSRRRAVTPRMPR